ncbi:MAG: DUF4254 domain-containing protein [Streptosporangiaceae bacterium]|nr:DUF4254 domain-containing protein [Streptosporangiaceae bacterium]
MNVTASEEGSPLAIATRLATAVGVPAELVHELYQLHARQWRLENETRAPDASPDVIAAAKTDIDSSNARRHRLIDQIDAVATRPTLAKPCRYYSETVGELCDRLLILDLKRRALSTRNETSVASAAGRLPDEDLGADGVERVCCHLASAVTQLIDDLAEGHAALPPRVGMKVYNSSARQEEGKVRTERGLTVGSAPTIGG